MGACGLCVLLASLFSFADLETPDNTDDAFITLVYARHLADSGLFYWNAEDGNIDGFTSFLDVVIKAVAIRLTAMDPIALNWWMNLTWHLSIGLSAFVIGIFLNLGGARLRVLICSLLGGLAVATCPSLATGSNMLLETPFFVLFGLWAVVYIAISRIDTWLKTLFWTLLLIVTSLIRPEGLLLVMGLGVYRVVEDWRSDNRLKSFIPLTILIVASLVYFSWHLWTFGALAPNTYYAKTSASRLNEIIDGLRYVTSTSS